MASRPRLLDLFCGAGGAASNVPPCFPADDSSDRRLIKAELSGQGAERHSSNSKKTQFPHSIFGQLRRWVGYTRHDFATPPCLFTHVKQIVELTSQHKMAGIDTRRIVAFVHNTHSNWNSAIVNFPTDPMCLETPAQSLHLAVTTRFSRPLPNPTIILKEWSNVIPKLLLYRLILSHDSSIPQSAPPRKGAV
jgi:hypothetical protein